MSFLDDLAVKIAETKAAIAQCNGESYRSCWVDTVKDRRGKQVYYRLRWFKSRKPKKLGSRTLKPNEVGEAKRAIALWTELQKLEKQMEDMQQQVTALRCMASAMGLEITVK